MVHSEIKEITDYFVCRLISTLPRYKVNSFAQGFANSLLVMCHFKGDSKNLPKNSEGYWVFRNGNFICQLLLDTLNNCAISPAELLNALPEQVSFKIEKNGILSSVCGSESKMTNMIPFKKIYFEIPLRVLKVAIRQRMNMLVYRHSFDGGYPNNFIPLGLVSPDSLGIDSKLHEYPMFQAVGLPIYLFSAEQLNKTTFGSHNSAQLADAAYDTHGPSGDDTRHSLFSESQKIDFFAPGWWERIVMSQVVVDYAEDSKTNSYVSSVLNLV